MSWIRYRWQKRSRLANQRPSPLALHIALVRQRALVILDIHLSGINVIVAQRRRKGQTLFFNMLNLHGAQERLRIAIWIQRVFGERLIGLLEDGEICLSIQMGMCAVDGYCLIIRAVVCLEVVLLP